MSHRGYFFVVGMLAVVAAVVAIAILPRGQDGPPDRGDDDGYAYAGRFVDVLAESGIDFTMGFLPGEQGEHFKINLYDHGAGVAVGDVNGDGLDDLYFLNQLGANALYHNLGRGKFVNATEASGGVGLEGRVSVGATFSDYDNDGDQDLYVTTVRAGNVLFQNQGNGTFRDVTRDVGLTYVGHSQAAAFFDAEADGDLDLILTNTANWTTDFQDENDNYYIGLGDFHDLVDAKVEHNVFYRNDGAGKFVDATAESGLEGRGWNGDVAIADHDGDGDVDVYLASMFFADQLMLNDGSGKFTDATDASLGKTSWGSMGSKSLDFDNDGLLDLLVVDMHSDMWMPGTISPTAIEESRKYNYSQGPMPETSDSGRRIEEKLVESLQLDYSKVRFGNSLFHNLGAGKYEEVSDQANAETFWPWGAATGDFDNDGFEDVFVPTGMGYPYFYWPNRLLANRGDGKFAEQSGPAGLDPPARGTLSSEHIGGRDAPRSSRCAVTLDFDRDGRLDLVVGNFNDAPYVYRNDSPQRRYIAFKLTGTKSNRDAIGAVVKLHFGKEVMTRQVQAAGGYLSHSSKTLHFGLGDRQRIDRCEIAWPSGRNQTLENLEINQLHEITEPN